MKSTEPHPSRRLSAEFSNFQTLYKTRGSTQWVWTNIGALLVAIGVYIEVQPRLTYLPPDGLVTAITMRSGWPFGRVKWLFTI